MGSPCSHRAFRLREKNRALLDQLESNSILLERRLQKLKRTAKTKKSSDKSWQELPPSPLKRKYEAWKARNNSGQVSAALNADFYNCSDSSLNDKDTPPGECKQKLEDVTSPAKRTKHNRPTLSSKPKKKILVHKLNKDSHKPLKSSTAIQLTEDAPEDCTDCCCKNDSRLCEILSDISSQGEEEEPRPPLHIANSDREDRDMPESHSKEQMIYDSSTDSERQKTTLASAKAIINYSPESVFLRRLKERSEAIGDLIAPGNIRPVIVSPCKKSPLCTKRIPNTVSYRAPRTSPVHGEEKHHSARPDLRKQIFAEKQGHSTRSPTKKIKKKSDRKRTCYRKSCYCRVLKNKSKKELSEDKENLETRAADQDDKVPYHSSTVYQHINPAEVPLIISDTMAEQFDNRKESKSCNCRCCSCKDHPDWFDRLNEFRNSHWFDCHAHPHRDPACPKMVARDTETQKPPHKCVHEFLLDDRLFIKPMFADHRNVSCCAVCHLPSDAPKAADRGTAPITLPSSLQEPEIRVTVPDKEHTASGNVLSQKNKNIRTRPNLMTKGPLSSTSGNMKRMVPPAPANSLALRYQKGVAK